MSTKRVDEREYEYFIVRGNAVKKDNEKSVVLHVGEWHGMGGVTMPAWSEHGATPFKTAEEAAAMYPHMGMPYDCKDLTNVVIKRIKVKKTTVTVEFDLDEPDEKI